YIFRMTFSILNKFTLTCDLLSHFQSKFCNPVEPHPSQYTCKVHLDQLRALWDKVEKEYEACLELISVALPTLRAKYDYSYFIYERCSAQIMEHIETISAKSAPVQPIPPQNSDPSGCRLPPCDTEVFSGDYLRWPAFRDLFTAVYIDNPALTPVKKLFFLNAKIIGEANSIVSNSPLTSDGFRSAWRNLTERFENKRSSLMDGYEVLGHMKEVHPKNIPSDHYFIPHHCVLKPESSTTKLRVVFDASCKTTSKKLLNDMLYAGPIVQSELFAILLR
ncbi:hypothetical protein KR054_004350, partial [Drosophila jambulina]